ncbi:LLM class flavin-dependent oxidoreductase [Streptomyces sp. NPDC049881]|uniref:LLM class flavin-dependent oxidoreductase n=1 Tax=Streptomyces sp. NPDC049881 TaxID=3155778 RepID=UPI003417D58A
MNAAAPGRVGVWAGDFDALPAREIREAAAAAEDLGYGTLWFPETTGREAMAQAAILLAATRRVTVGSGMTDLYARDPVTTAAGWRTLDEAYPGRFLLALWDSHPSITEDVRGHRSGPPVETMRRYLDALDTAPSGPPGAAGAPYRLLAALGPEMLGLAAERAGGATVLGMPAAYTRVARGVLGDGPLLAVTQLCVLADGDGDRDRARATAAAALPNRRELLRGLGHEDPDALGGPVIDALVAYGGPGDIARRVREHLAAGADHVSLHVVAADGERSPARRWERLAAHLPL